MRIENKFYKSNKWRKAKIKLRQYVSLLKSPNFDSANIKCFTVYESCKNDWQNTNITWKNTLAH